MSAAVALGNVVGEAKHGLVIAVVPPQSAFDRDAVALGAHGYGLADDRGLGAVKVADEGGDAAVIAQLDLLGLDAAAIRKDDGDAAVEESELAQTVLERREVKLGLGESLGRWKKGHLGTTAPFGGSERSQRCIGIAMGKGHGIFTAV